MNRSGMAITALCIIVWIAFLRLRWLIADLQKSFDAGSQAPSTGALSSDIESWLRREPFTGVTFRLEGSKIECDISTHGDGTYLSTKGKGETAWQALLDSAKKRPLGQ
jgi:hypothetical protein